MITINFIFSIGLHCNSPDFLKRHNISRPFDYLFINIDTAFDNINNSFDLFLQDIVVVNIIYYSDKKINKHILDFIF